MEIAAYFIEMREWSSPSSWLNFTDLDCTAAYSFTGTVTSPKEIVPVQIARGMAGLVPRAGVGGNPCEGAPTPACAIAAAGTTSPMATIRSASQGILADDKSSEREHIVELLKRAYFMELETVISYITNSVNPDGVRAQEIIESLNEDIQEELGHAQQFAARIKELYGVVPGSMEFTPEQSYLQPPGRQTDITHVIRGVIEAETGAIEHYNRIIEDTEGVDPVTNDMLIAILRDEEGHRRLFEGYLREYEAEDLA